MKQSKKHFILAILIIAFALTTSPSFAQDRPDGWDDYSHSNATDPDYDVVFPQDAVNTITITIEPETWQTMLDDMTDIYGEFGTQRGGMGRGQMPDDGMERRQRGGQRLSDEGGFPFDGNQQPPFGDGQMPFDGGMGRGGMLGASRNPIWVSADLTFNGQTWTNIGIRFKGNSSLMSSWGSGSYKLPFRFNFDYFEDEYPEIHNQRFFGFKKLSFTNNWGDESFLREKVASDVFREAGIPVAQTAFYAVYVDYGDGPVYFGLYTAVEVVDDTVIESNFEDSSGNLYKPEGTGATFAEGTFDETHFEKQSNENEADFSDIIALFDALHAETRLTDVEAWRDGLESVFNVDGFLHWLAVNSVIQNWDTYGGMAHNYYIYHDPSTGLLTWLPWDLNLSMQGAGGMFGGGRGGMGNQMMPDFEAMQEMFGGQMPDMNLEELSERMERGGFGGMGGRNNNTIGQENVNESWPLIRYLLDDSVYYETYTTYVQQVSEGAFEPTKIEAILNEWHELITPYVVGDEGEQAGYTHLSSEEAFDRSLDELIAHIYQRQTLVEEFLNP
jgi:spore coat protein H